MLHTIRWMVQREREEVKRRVHKSVLMWFLLGGLAGGALSGSLISIVARGGYMVLGKYDLIFALLASLIATAYLGNYLGFWSIPAPQLRHQVPEAWRNVFGTRTAGLLYAAALGFTFFTRINSLALYPLVVLLMGMGKWPIAVILIMALLGLVRAGTALVLTHEDLSRLDGNALLAWSESKLRGVRLGEGSVLVGAAIVPIAWFVFARTSGSLWGGL